MPSPDAARCGRRMLAAGAGVAAWRFAFAERDRREDRIGRAGGRPCRPADVERPLARRRWTARSRDSRRRPDSAGAAARRSCRPAPTRAIASCTPIAERLLEDRERLILAGLLQVGRRREDDLLHRDAGRRVDGQLGRNQQRIARLVRLGVETFGERHLAARRARCRQRRTPACSTAATTSAFGRLSCARASFARQRTQRNKGHRGGRHAKARPCLPLCPLFSFVSLSLEPDRFQRNRPRRAAAASSRSTVPLTGGRSWIHEIPLPSLGRVRRLQPVPRFERRVERQRRQSLQPAHRPAKRATMSARTSAALWYVERHAERRCRGSRGSASLPCASPGSGIAREVPCRRPC